MADDERVPGDWSIAPESAFATLSDQTRLQIIQELGQPPGYTASFSALHEALGATDSSRFNYHLQQLTDTFVRKTDDGYQLRYAGRLVHRMIQAGMFTDYQRRTPVEIQSACPTCGATLEASYADGRHRVLCPDCASVYFRNPLHPAGLENRTFTEVVEASDRLHRTMTALATDGICPHCSGIVTPTIVNDHTRPFGQPFVDHTCENCGLIITTNVGTTLLTTPTVISFFHNHHVDLRTEPTWDLPFCIDDDYLTVRSRDPWRIVVSMPLGDEELAVTVDKDLAVIDSERRE